ncbi:uncharacterized protein KY384_001998 [Bacidia gigantensis]|uniref:uncharacterized protein n=1 Tax=Bacidia gigantensis TaxID=2732470 RepID=UPI001D05BA1A|nr:uncharacterized protein KY384_001998 [Bacidia gigantensis]KAG8533215.1 hypothetical protein KY384_001998 [Bacidia gigantensis]
MSRAVQAQQNGMAFAAPGQDDDMCPVCRSTRYLNSNLRFLVNPTCYHKMCESCVDRIFSQGPAPCPVAGCARTLRKARFRKQTFEDLKIEREVDIRSRVAKVFNRRQEEFLNLRNWNDYLEQVETLTFNLLYEVDVEETEAKMASYEAQNAESIRRNKILENQEHESFEAASQAQKAQAWSRREEALREDEDERKERVKESREEQNRIARGGKAKVALKKSTARKKEVSKGEGKTDSSAPAPVFEIQGLKPMTAPKPKEAYDPFGRVAIIPEYYTLKKDYEHPWLEKARTDPAITTGGYDVHEYCARAMMEAFAGMGVFI